MPASGAADFDLATVEAVLGGTQFAGQVQHMAVTASTSTLALEAAQAGAEGGVWVADVQTAGRGRGGHGWHSATGEGLHVSALVLPKLPLARALWLSLATGLAAQAAIMAATGLRVDIRWPNDLILHERKCGGILVETAVDSAAGMLRYAVIGVGINVNHVGFPAEMAEMASSLRQASGRLWSREELLGALLCALDREIELLHGAAADLLERFAAASSWVLGKRVEVDEDGGYTGVTAGLNADGFLLVEGDDGVRRTVRSGGVRPYGSTDRKAQG